MEGFMSKKQRFTHLTTSQTSLGIHKSSHTISKPSNNNIVINKPKIRIIHIFAPEIIKTDAANFRELVQRLTGKPTEKDYPSKKKLVTTKPRVVPRSDDDHDQDQSKKSFPMMISKPLAKKLDMNKSTITSNSAHGFNLGFDHHHHGFGVRDQSVVKEELDQEDEEEIWNINGSHNQENIHAISGGGFLDKLDFEGFIEELDHQFPFPSLLNPNLDSNSSHLQFGFGPQLA